MEDEIEEVEGVEEERVAYVLDQRLASGYGLLQLIKDRDRDDEFTTEGRVLHAVRYVPDSPTSVSIAERYMRQAAAKHGREIIAWPEGWGGK